MKRTSLESNVRGVCRGRDRGSVFLLLLPIIICLAGCGTGYQPSPAPVNTVTQTGSSASGQTGSGGSQPPFVSTTSVLINLDEFGDIPAQVVSFYVTVEGINLLSDQPIFGAELLQPRRLEISRKNAEPLTIFGGTVPEGKYSGITVRLSNAVISYIDANGVLHENVAATLTAPRATNPSEFTLGSTPGGINLNLGFDVNFGASNAVSVTPRLNFSTGLRPVKNLLGRILYSGPPFLMDADAFRDVLDPSYIEGVFSPVTDNRTEFQGLTGSNELKVGATVAVDAAIGSDGVLYASRVELESGDPNAEIFDGLTFDLAPAELQMLVRTVHAPNNVEFPIAGKIVKVTVNNSTQFRVSGGDFDLTHLGFTPAFDALTVARGQNLRVATLDHSKTSVAAEWIKLEPQSVDGVAGAVASGSVSGQFSFPIKLAADSALARLTGQTSIDVTVQPSTEKLLYFGMEDCITCIKDGDVHVQGLLFYSAGQYHLVASKVAVI